MNGELRPERRSRKIIVQRQARSYGVDLVFSRVLIDRDLALALVWRTFPFTQKNDLVNYRSTTSAIGLG